jgi:predicted aspartyl protease
MTYGQQQVTEEGKGEFQAIIDTGSSQLSIPPSVFASLVSKWRETLPDLQCKDSKTFCFVEEACESVVQKI